MSKGKGSVELAELYTIGIMRSGKEHNLARFGEAISSGTVDGMEAALAFDNNLNGNYNMGSIARTEVKDGAYLGLRLDGAAKVSRLLLYSEMNSRDKVIDNSIIQLLGESGNVLFEKTLSEAVAKPGAMITSYGVE